MPDKPKASTRKASFREKFVEVVSMVAAIILFYAVFLWLVTRMVFGSPCFI